MLARAIACAVLLAMSVTPGSMGGAAIAQQSGVLRLAGALHCTAWLAEQPEKPTTAIDCEFHQLGGLSPVHYEGEIVGSGLYLVNPGTVRLMWNVMAPAGHVAADALVGTYDITTRHDLALAEGSGNILFGGRDDIIGLQLVAPAVDGVRASTRLELRRAS